MKIGIDIDEVVADFLPAFLKFHNAKYNRNVLFENFSFYQFWKVLGGTREEAVDSIMEFYETDGFENVALVDGAKESILKLAKSNELFFVTSRPSKIKSQTESFLRKHFGDISFDVFYTGDFFDGNGKTKAEVCEELGLNYFVEDNKEYATECAKTGAKVFLLDNPWNQGSGLHDNIVRVWNWGEILEAMK